MPRTNPDFLLSIYLRGGADGLSFLPPYDDPNYQSERENLKFTPPSGPPWPYPPPPEDPQEAKPLTAKDTTTSPNTPAFGLAPALQPLKSLFDDGTLSFVHACGSVVDTRSHFDQQTHTELGTVSGPSQIAIPTKGILARHLEFVPPSPLGKVRALAIQPKIPTILKNALGTTPVDDPPNFAFPGEPSTAQFRQDLLESLYTLEDQPIKDAFANAMDTVEEIVGLNFDVDPPGLTGPYPDSPLGNALKQAAVMAKELPALEIVHVDSGGWDTHAFMGPHTGYLESRMEDLALSLRAFVEHAQQDSRNFVVLVMTEFGRTLAENASLGTDHGRGGVAIVAANDASHIYGGEVHANWPGLGPNQVDAFGDLKVSTDLRDVIGEMLERRLCGMDPETLFADDQSYGHTQLDIFKV